MSLAGLVRYAIRKELSKHNVIARTGQAVVFRYNPHRRKLVVLFTANGMAEASMGDNSS